ncbi:3-hydroxyacyl-CoA dehydrogenase [Cladochytrium replicatum]|nr:3-hydroxyacyl-CoA dehydrogenase [Cladochytrium replicatum]
MFGVPRSAGAAARRGQYRTMAYTAGLSKIVVVGAGLMGSGIAQVSAQSNLQVTLVDVKHEFVENGRDMISTSLKRVAKKKFEAEPDRQESWVNDVMSRIKTSTDTTGSAKDAHLIIEAIVENLAAKRALFKSLDEVAPNHTIFASNTSSLPIGDIADATSRRDRFVGLHFFNPVPQMKLVEIIRLQETSDEVFDSLVNFTKQLSKVPVSCKDTPGFIVNRLLVPYMLEAARLVERGEATKEDVDTAMKLGAGYPMGPFELMDYVGLDTMKFITDGWYKDSKELKGKELVAPVRSIDELTAEKKLGRKSGEGFYPYKK